LIGEGDGVVGGNFVGVEAVKTEGVGNPEGLDAGSD
jgi:hypothetical protein